MSSSASVAASQQNGARPAAAAMRRPVVPVIPITYAQRRRKPIVEHQPAAPDLPAGAAGATTPATVRLPSSISAATPELLDTPPTTASGDEDAEETITSASPVVSSLSVAVSPSQEGDAAMPSPPDSQGAWAGSLEVEVPQGTDAVSVDRHEHPDRISSHAKRTVAPSQMPPPFFPAQEGQNLFHSSDNMRMPPPPPQRLVHGQLPMHHAHPSTGSFVLGGYSDSNASSPAPPQAAAYMPPPPPYQQATLSARTSMHQQSLHYEHPLAGYPQPDQYASPKPAVTSDGLLAHVPMANGVGAAPLMPNSLSTGSSPSPTQYMNEQQRMHAAQHSTPHSMHGSQSSMPPQEGIRPGTERPVIQAPAIVNGNMYGHARQTSYPAPALSTSVTSPTSFMPPPGMLPHSIPTDHLDGLNPYLRSQFADATYADMTLELRYSDDRAVPVRIPGHGMLLARSPKLKQLIDAQIVEAHRGGSTSRTILLQSEDRFLRSDAFWLAVQRLYGAPLLDHTTLPGASTPLTPESPLKAVDRLDLALGYIASGHLLEMSPVVERGVQIACQMLSWSTVEKALGFALQGGLDFTWTSAIASIHDVPTRSLYGPASNKIIHEVLKFLIANFPTDFVLDTTARPSPHLQRLPSVLDSPAAVRTPLSSIQFGDLASSTSAPTQALKMTSPNTTLSRILLEVPFRLLQCIMEAPMLGNVSRWTPTSPRQEIMRAVVGEREARRIKVHVSKQVSNAEREKQAQAWNVVGWQESVISPPTDLADEPTVLGRSWVGTLLSESA